MYVSHFSAVASLERSKLFLLILSCLPVLHFLSTSSVHSIVCHLEQWAQHKPIFCLGGAFIPVAVRHVGTGALMSALITSLASPGLPLL